jgi:hypothetical protein
MRFLKWSKKVLNGFLLFYYFFLSFFFVILSEIRVILIHRFKYGHAEEIGMPYLIFLMVGRKVLKDALSQGYLAHSKDELYEIGIKDLKSLETFLANKKYFFGESPTVEDAIIFGFTAQLVFHDTGPLNDFILSVHKYSSLFL